MDLEIYMLGLIKEINTGKSTGAEPKSEKPATPKSNIPEDIKEEKPASAKPYVEKSSPDIPGAKKPATQVKEKQIPKLENLNAIWTEVLKEVKEKSTTLSTILANSKIHDLGNNIKIELAETNNYLKTTLEKSKKFLQSKISDKLGRAIQLEFAHKEKQENKPAGQPAVKPAGNLPVDSKESIIVKTFKIFDAKVVKREGN
jgi:hypothetical protein